MDIGHDHVQLFEFFADACEQLTVYGIKLRASGQFFDVRNGDGIRNYRSGWRFETWIEADIHKGGVAGGGFCALWWLELGPGDPAGLMLDATLSVDPDHSYISLPSRTAVTLSDFKEALAAVVYELETALENNAEFIHAIETARVEATSA
jgi:hypothetical protein